MKTGINKIVKMGTALVIEEEGVPLAVVVDEVCFVHWILAALTILFIGYEIVRILMRRGKMIQRTEFAVTTIYIISLLVVLAFGNCEMDIITAVVGAAAAISNVAVLYSQYKKGNLLVRESSN